MNKKSRRISVIIIVLLSAFSLVLAGCAATGQPRVQREYGAPKWQQEIEIGCAKHYGVVLEVESNTMHTPENVGLFIGSMAGAGVLASVFQDAPGLGMLVAGGGAYAAYNHAQKKRASSEDAISGYNECVRLSTEQYLESQNKQKQSNNK